jgi:hypothetical protein
MILNLTEREIVVLVKALESEKRILATSEYSKAPIIKAEMEELIALRNKLRDV